ncbi:adenylate kinase family enzyme [Bradyrhizobium sp. USDA 3650]
MKSRRIHLMGASGSGVTTLGRALAGRLALPHHDSDDYFWLPTAPPYQTTRPAAERLRLMREMFLPRLDWVLSGTVTGWGDELVPFFDLVVFVTTPRELRLQRLHDREATHFGADAVAQGGWRHEEVESFVDWASHYEAGDRDGRVSQKMKRGSRSCPARSCASTAHARLRTSSSSYAAKRSGCRVDVLLSLGHCQIIK